MKKNIAIFVYDNVEILDFTGPYEVFSIANELQNRELFNLFLISENNLKIVARNEFKFNSDYCFNYYPNIDYLIIPGGPGSRTQEKNTELVSWLQREFFKIEHLLTICTGSRILVNTNILTTEQITTHWNSINHLKDKKNINVIENVRYTDNGKILTSAGVSSGIDLCLYFLEKKYGSQLYEKTKKYIEWNQI